VCHPPKHTHVQVHNLTIRAKGKVLLENTNLTIAAGRRYGLAGPNGKGKTTLLKLMARRQIPVPDTIDVLLVEQEVREGGSCWGSSRQELRQQ
jgi:ATP-binding cassette subfamily F protein 1